MEPAGRYARDNFCAFFRPQFCNWRIALRTLWKCTLGLFVATLFGLLFGFLALKERVRKRYATRF